MGQRGSALSFFSFSDFFLFFPSPLGGAKRVSRATVPRSPPRDPVASAGVIYVYSYYRNILYVSSYYCMQVLAVPAEPGGIEAVRVDKPGSLHVHVAGAQFTCFTSTKVGIEAVRVDKPGSLHVHVGGAQFTCFTSTKVQILTPEELCMCVCGSAH